jgi:Cu2+-exporting ATPase
LSRALAEAAGPGAVLKDVREVPGEGLEATVDGLSLRLGRAAWAGVADGTVGATQLWFRKGATAPVIFAFEDRLRADAKATVAALGARGFEVEMLSGDRDAPAAAIAREAGIAQWRAASDPAQKAARLGALRAQGRRTLMAGDGLNDAAALALAHVSVSPGTAADAAQAQADMVLQGDDLAPLAEAVDVARAARRLVFQNFAFAAVYNLAAVPLAALGHVTPLIAAVAMSASSLIVMLNALRLARR